MIEAWRQAVPDAGNPRAVRMLSRKPKARVYQLQGIPPDGRPVVAKEIRSGPGTPVEVILYEHVLPQLESRLPHLHEHVAFDGSWWLFLEDCGPRHYSSDRPHYVDVAAAWLGSLHSGAADLLELTRLPDRGPDTYMIELRALRTMLGLCLAVRPLNGVVRTALASTDRVCGRLEEAWDGLEAICSPYASTLVHADFADRNICLQGSSATPSLRVLDWERAGVGPPAPDLEQLTQGSRRSAAIYCDRVRSVWSHLDTWDVERLALCGIVFRLVAVLRSTVRNLGGVPIESSLMNLRISAESMSAALAAALWLGR